jgi:hypothetical protein
VIISASDGPLVYGFLLSQKNKVDELGLEKEGLPRFNMEVKAMQASLREIERKSGVTFDAALHQYDVKADSPNANEKLSLDMSNFIRRRDILYAKSSGAKNGRDRKKSVAVK